MKKKLFTNLAFAMLLVLSLFTSCQSAAAAPTGEIVIVQSTIGREIPIPWEELIQANDWMKLLYDPLIGTTANAELSTEMGLARKWEMSPDGLTWTFYIRKGVKFHDGMELTAKDVKFTIEMDLAPGSKVSDIESLRKTIKSMEIKDPYTLVINCKIPSLFLPHGFLSDIGANAGLILPKEYYEKVGRDNFYKKPIGTGPYKFHSQVTGTHFKMEATDKHWRDGVPRYKYVTFRIIPEESSRIAMLKTGSADIARISREREGILQLITRV